MTSVPEYVARVLADAPPLSDEAADRIALLLRPDANRGKQEGK